MIACLPQLGGNFFDTASRPPGLPSLRIACPLVGTEELNATSSRTRNLALANEEILQRSKNACVGSISCSCEDCSSTRSLLFSTLNRLTLDAPPLPLEPPPLPPSTPPPRFAGSGSRSSLRPIPEETLHSDDPNQVLVQEPEQSLPHLGISHEVTLLSSSLAGNDTIVRGSPTASLDQRWLEAPRAVSPWGALPFPSSPRSVGDDASLVSQGVVVGSPTASETRTHFSPHRFSPIDALSDSDWDVLNSTNQRYARTNADYFDIASNADNASRCSSSWAFDWVLGPLVG